MNVSGRDIGIGLGATTLGITGAALGGTAGNSLALSRGIEARKPWIIAGAVVGGAVLAYLGYRALNGGAGSGGSVDGRTVGTALGRKTIDHGDGTSEWATVTVPLLLGKHVGAAEGYATLTQAVEAAKPNTGAGEMAFIREGAGVTAFKLTAPGLEAVESYTADASNVVAYTTPQSNLLIAGPAATDAERAADHLADTPRAVPTIAPDWVPHIQYA